MTTEYLRACKRAKISVPLSMLTMSQREKDVVRAYASGTSSFTQQVDRPGIMLTGEANPRPVQSPKSWTNWADVSLNGRAMCC